MLQINGVTVASNAIKICNRDYLKKNYFYLKILFYFLFL